MARRKLQMTAFARFFLFIIIFVPALFFGVSYVKGEDGVQTLKNLLGMETTEESSSKSTADSDNADTKTLESAEVKRLNDELEVKEEKIKELYRENEKLIKEAADAKKDLEKVQSQLDAIRKAMPDSSN